MRPRAIPRIISLLLLFPLCTCAPSPSPTLFSLLESERTGINFVNTVTENDTFNILDFEFVYNGGGVAVADFNADGLEDLYFTGNQVPNAMYLNQGNFTFTNVTESSNTKGAARWCSGVVAGDVNGDGLPDLYVAATVYPTAERRKNLLFINEGNNAEGIPLFSEQAEAYGLADTSHTTQAALLDYDRDGDLDLYLVINEMDDRLIPNRYLPKKRDGSGRRNDRLYRNDGTTFTNVTKEAGILQDGYGLGVSICDLNSDGWPDIYVTNDYLSNDLLWINNQDGTFTDQAASYFKHTAYSAMGNDVADLNNDGLDDVLALDMFPETNIRRKAMMPPNNYIAYINNDRFGYQYQFTRNVLQLAQGNRPEAGNEPMFSEIGGIAGVASTDWSWSALAADYDLDGDRDLLISNGFPKDVTDKDFMDYNIRVGNIASRQTLLPQIPVVKISNYAFANDGKTVPGFDKVTKAWGLDQPSFSNGAAYADLDNDGDLDYVVNNINDEAFVYRNNLMEQGGQSDSYLTVALRQTNGNPTAIGARVTVLDAGKQVLQTAYQNPVRGYLSSVTHKLHLGVDSTKAQFLGVQWPDGRYSEHPITGFNQVVEIVGPQSGTSPPRTNQSSPLFVQAPEIVNAFSPHRDSLFIDYRVQPLLPHLLSEYGPGLAVADVNGDGRDDLYRSGSHFFSGELLVQNEDGSFSPAPLPEMSKGPEELGSLFFDADGDGDQDLYLTSGGSEMSIDRDEYLDRLLFNDGTGAFNLSTDALPAIKNSSSCIRAADVDHDGDLDLFVGGRLEPARYPKPVDSHLLLNNGKGKFSLAAENPFTKLGLVNDALFTDYNNDGWTDLLVAGQGMSLRLFENQQGTFIDATPAVFTDKVGWWNGLTGADFDHDGDIDYLTTNFGGNHLYQIDGKDFVGLYGADFDGNGGYDLLLSSRALGEDGELYEFPHFQRKDTEKQLVIVKDQYPFHKDFGRVTMEQFLMDFSPKTALIQLRANYLRSAWIENLGNGNFAFHDLPRAAQAAPLFAATTTDLTGDGYQDIVAVGNDYGAEVGGGRIDALNGVCLIYDPEAKDFRPLSMQESGFYVPGNGRSLAQLRRGDQRVLVAGENQGPTRAFAFTGQGRWYTVKDQTARLLLTHRDGQQSIRECYYGNGFLSQSSRQVWLPEGVTEVEEIGFGEMSR